MNKAQLREIRAWLEKALEDLRSAETCSHASR